MKNTIENLTVTKTFYKRDRDAYGNRTKEPYQKKVKREVQVVTGWTRFGHYIIDAIIIGFLAFGFKQIWIDGANAGFMGFLGIRMNGLQYNFIPSLENILITVGYYFTCEATMQRTIGKYATNSIVINQYAEKPDTGSLLGRSFARMVPFEALSCLSERGWHDRWSNTYVVTMGERAKLRALLNEQEGIFISESEDILD